MLTQEELKRHLDYNPETGVFTWKIRNSNRVKIGEIAGRKCNTKGYLRIVVCKVGYYAHRLAWLYEYGDIPLQFIDHIDGLKTNNTIANLRLASNSQNLQNRGKRVMRKSKSGHKNVYWSIGSNAWVVQLMAQGTRIYGGLFKVLEDAIAAAIVARNKYHGEFANHGELL